MDFSQGSFLSICVLSALLGAKHGFDPDHLATIDALTRLGRGQSRRFVGILFSLGHGLVVITVAFSIAWLGKRWAVPYWFETVGLMISIALLLVLGSMNLWALLATPRHEQVGLRGLRSRYIVPVQLVTALPLPWDRLVPFFVGALFAFSFDTLSQAVLFTSITAAQNELSPALVAAALGCAFTVGMVISDGLNGWFIGALVQRADKTAAAASRLMCGAVVLISYVVAGLAIVKLLQHHHQLVIAQLDGWLASVAITAVMAMSFAFGQLHTHGKKRPV